MVTWLGLRPFERSDRRVILEAGIEVAAATNRGQAIVAAMVQRLREAGVVLPTPTTLERVALIAPAQARRQAFAALARGLGAGQAESLNQLLRTSAPGGRTALAWIREWPESPSAGNLKALLERLGHVRALQVEADRARRVHASRYGVISREALIMSA